MKKQIRLTESELHNIIGSAVKKLVFEYTDAEKKRIYGYRPDSDEDDEFNEQPTNVLASEGNLRLNSYQLSKIIKESVEKVISEMDFRTLRSAEEKASAQAQDETKPRGLRNKRMQQATTFAAGIKPQMQKDYGLSRDQVNDAIAGNGQSYSTANRRELKNMDRLFDDNFNYNRGLANYNQEIGKWV